MDSEAVVMRATGAPDVLELRDVEIPWPAGPRQVLVRMEAASVNPADTYFRAFGPYFGDGRGTVLGHDGAGIVEAVGEAVDAVKLGERVCFYNGGIGADPGTYSRHAIVPEALLARIPDSVDMQSAAALPLVFITAWEALVERARLGKGETALIHGGAGGTGHIAIQVARELGARVATTISDDSRQAQVIDMGAEIAINYRRDVFVDAARHWTGGAGVDVAFDNAGPEVFQQTLKAMAPYGRLVTLMGMPGDLEDEVAYNHNLSILNVMMLTPMWLGLEAERLRQADIVRRGLEWLDTQRMIVNVAESFPLERAAEAHARLEQGRMTGKILLTI